MKKLFVNDRFYVSAVTLAAIGGFLQLVYNKIVVDNGVFDEAPLFLSAVCSVFIYISYKKHSKNVMKGMMGALLAGLLIYSYNLMSSLSVDALSIAALVAFILTLLIFVNHFIINAEHQASPQSVLMNQVSVFLLALTEIIRGVLRIKGEDGVFNSGIVVINIVTLLAVCVVIVCVESRLDAYRLNREKAGWTEETGYPEGYRHEYEKDKH